MRDEERIQVYYSFGTTDYSSELFSMRKKEKKTISLSALRPLKLAAIIWMEAIKSLSPAKK